MTAPLDLEVVGQVQFTDVAQAGLDTPEAMESAVFALTEWLSELGAQPGDELVLIRHHTAPVPE